MTLAGPIRPAYLLYHLFWSAVDWLFPPTCGGCSRTGIRWCDDCQHGFRRITDPVCSRCGSPVSSGLILNGNTECHECAAAAPQYTALRSYGVYEDSLRNAILRLKYKGDIGLGEALSKHLIELYNHLKWDIDLIVPVPLGAHRGKERGYNQSGLIGKPLAYAVHKPFLPKVLQRNRETRSQVGLSAGERRANVAGAFSANQNLVRGRTILVIDDVTTTGSTIGACAQALCEAGASAVYGMTLARAVLDSHTDNQPNPSYTRRR